MTRALFGQPGDFFDRHQSLVLMCIAALFLASCAL